jgi:hypothetical protein
MNAKALVAGVATISELFELAGVKATRTGPVRAWRQRFQCQSLILINWNKCRTLDLKAPLRREFKSPPHWPSPEGSMAGSDWKQILAAY